MFFMVGGQKRAHESDFKYLYYICLPQSVNGENLHTGQVEALAKAFFSASSFEEKELMFQSFLREAKIIQLLNITV